MPITPVILSGGAGTRLWPVSRQSRPKQLIDLIGSGQTLLQATLQRVSGTSFNDPVIIANAQHRFLIAQQLQEIGQKGTIILEPEGRNTAPAIALAAAYLAETQPDAQMLVLPSDHLVKDADAYSEAISTASKAALTEGHLVTFGIKPHKPETGFGYIEQGAERGEVEGAFTLKRFVEKPDLETAKKYVATGQYVWNAGMFLFSIASVAKAFQADAPDVFGPCVKAISEATKETDFVWPDQTAFSRAQAISFDYAIMEKTNAGVVVPCDIGWSDVGSFDGLWEVLEHDANGNAAVGDAYLEKTGNSLALSTGPAIAAYGVHDLAIIATPDVVTVLPRSESQFVKDLREILKADGHPAALRNPSDPVDEGE